MLESCVDFLNQSFGCPGFLLTMRKPLGHVSLNEGYVGAGVDALILAVKA